MAIRTTSGTGSAKITHGPYLTRDRLGLDSGRREHHSQERSGDDVRTSREPVILLAATQIALVTVQVRLVAWSAYAVLASELGLACHPTHGILDYPAPRVAPRDRFPSGGTALLRTA